MKFIVILLSLGLERYLAAGTILKRFSWFDHYIAFLKRVGRTESLWRGPQGVAWMVLPLFLVVAILYYALTHLFFGTVGTMLSFLIFIYCIGPEDLYQQVQRYLIAREDNDHIAMQQYAEKIIAGTPPSDDATLQRTVTESIFYQANVRVFGVVFWFMVLGPLGALLFRLADLIEGHIQAESQNYDASLAIAAKRLFQILEWLPARLTGLLYALAGSFSRCFGFWIKHLLSGMESNQMLVCECGLLSLDIAKDDLSNTSTHETRAALAMVDRVTILVLAVVLIFTLGALF